MAKNKPQRKVKNAKQTIKKLLGLLKPYRAKFIFVLIFAMLSTVFSVIGPRVMGEATTVLFEGLLLKIQGLGDIDFARITQIIALLLFIYGLSVAFQIIHGFIMAGISRNLTYNLRKDMHTKIEKLPLKYFDERSVGDILSLVSNDIDIIDSNLTSSLTQLLTAVTSIVGITYMMFTINVTMTLFALLILPLSFLMVVFIFSKSQRFFQAQQSNLGSLNGHVEEMYGAHVVVKAFNGEGKSIEEFDIANHKLYDSAWKSMFFSGLVNPVMNFIGNFAYVVISILGGYFAARGIIKVGDIQSFIQYMRNFMQPISQIGSLSASFQQSLAAAERVFEYLEAEEEVETISESIDIDSVNANVSFDNVTFGYDKNQPIIKNFSAEIEAGKKIAIAGPTGAGKTTSVKLLMRFYDIDQGMIKIGGLNIAEMKRSDLIDLIGMVL